MKIGDKEILCLEEKTGRKAKDAVEGKVVFVMSVDDNSKYELIRAGKTQVGILKAERIIKDFVKYR